VKARRRVNAMATPNMMRQFAMLPILWLSQKIDFTDPQNLLLLQMVFGTVMLGGYFLIQLAMRRAATLNDQTRVANPGKMANLAADKKAADGSCTACAYDVAKLKESQMQYVMGAVVAIVIYSVWGWTQPMMVLSVSQPMQLLDNKALLIYLRGHTYERPWAAADPLKQWMESQPEQAGTTTKATTALKSKKKN
jgi:hypothetical protein